MRIGRYEIERELGRGAMGIVYLAKDPAIDRAVAIKTVNISALSDPGQESVLRDRLVREARSAALLAHPSIVTVYDAVEHEGATCLVMEYVDGMPLSVLFAAKALDRARFVEILAQVAAALDHAHQAGVIHRDIKPANVLLNRAGVAKVTDFGLARVSGRKTTYSSNFLGTPGYMAPEQIKDEAVTGYTDQFALAVLAYEFLTGRKPFDAEAITSLIFKILQDPMPMTGLGDAVDSVFNRALAKNPADRYPTCSQFVSELRRALLGGELRASEFALHPHSATLPAHASSQASVQASARSSGSTGGGSVQAGAPGQTVTVRTPASAKPFRPLLPALGGALAVVVVVVGWYTWRSSPSGATHTPAPTSSSSAAEPPALPSANAAGSPELSQSASNSGAPASSPPAAPAPNRPKDPVAAPVVAPAARTPASNASAAASAAVTKASDAIPAETAPPKHRVRVSTQPSGALLIFDQNPDSPCVSPCDRDLPAGSHVVKATLAGHREVTSPFELPGTANLSILLERQQGVIAFDESLRGATIFLDGQEASVKPPAELQVPAGDHTVRLAAPNGAVFFERTLTVKHQGRIVVKGPAQATPAQATPAQATPAPVAPAPAPPPQEPPAKRRPPTLFKK
jgi:serine/threonine-protein kinase